jgi:stage V sporulation protein D (sporulation-specific penicillin-binding protein)
MSMSREFSRGRAGRTIRGRTLALMALCGVAIFLPLIWQLYTLQIRDHELYAQLAVDNQTRETTLSAARGTIYDCNGEVLATSVTVENVFLSPLELQQKDQNVEFIAQGLSEILGVDADWIVEQAQDVALQYKVVRRKVDSDLADQVRTFLNDNDIEGVYLEPDTKRVYPKAALAAQVLGFVRSSDNVGAEGIEALYDQDLTGTAGKIITARGNYGSEMLYKYEKYYDAADGNDVVLTIDATIQSFLEKNMAAAVEKYDVQNGAFGLVLDVKTGAILAMATLGSFDPNDYLEIYDTDQADALEQQRLEALLSGDDDAMDDYNDALVTARLQQWRNRVVSDGYEPGSTFKTVTLASALEEGAVTLNDTFFCSGSTTVKGRTKLLNCWKHAGHGSQSTAQALQNSCNVAFANIGIRLGGEALYTYIDAFGLLEKTGVDLPGEAAGVFFQKDVLTDPDSYASLTSVSFGQTFKITPLQLVRAEAAIVNGGYLLTPYVVAEVLDSDGNVVSETQPDVVRQVISEATSATMRDLLESVVVTGTAKNAQVAGYRIGGKTGTSEKIDVFDEDGNAVDDKIVSFIGVAPMDDPQIVCLVALDTPSTSTGFYISGGIMAAPTVRDVLADVLPYLGVEPDYTDESPQYVDVSMPDLTGMTAKQAEAALSELGLSCRTVGDGDTITDQIPTAGSTIPGGSQAVLYLGGSRDTDTVTVPNVLGLTAEAANTAITDLGLYLKAQGADTADATVTAQSPAAGTETQRGTVVTVEFTDHEAKD